MILRSLKNMLKKLDQYIHNSLLGDGFFYIPFMLIDRILFFCFFKFYYKKRFQYYGKNIRWGKNFRKLLIPFSVRISCPEKITISDNCSFDEGVYLQCDNKGDGIYFHQGCRVNAHTHFLAGAKITIGEKVLIAPFCLISSNNHQTTGNSPIMDQAMTSSGEITISSGTWLGHGGKILGGVILGQNSIVGASALVTRGTYKDRALLIGVPAKDIRHE